MAKNSKKQDDEGPIDEAIQENLPEETINAFFERIAFLKLSNPKKADLSKRINEESEGDPLFWIQISLSSLIATFGLLQNSVAVIIGAMLIAPLLRPIQGVSFGLTTGQSGSFWKASMLLIKSIILSIAVAYLFTLMVPLRSETPEILARTAPNLLDFFIAIASGILALLALSYDKLSNSLAGVAMAAALMPPLSIIGIELALGNLPNAWGSFFLFLTDLFAILVVGLVIFLFYGFYPHQANTQWKTIKNSFILIVIIGLMSVPLFSSLVQIAERINIQSQAEIILERSLDEHLTNPKLDRLELVDFSENSATFSTTVKISENEQFFTETRENIRQKLGEALDKEVTLQLEIVPIASIVSQKELEAAKEPSLEERIQQRVREQLSETYVRSTILTINVLPVSKEDSMEIEASVLSAEAAELDEDQQWAVKTIFTLPAGEAFTDSNRERIENSIREAFPDESFSFVWSLIVERTGMTDSTEPTPEESHLDELTLKWESFFKEVLPTTSSIENLDIFWLVNEERSFSGVVSLSNGSSSTFDNENIASYNVHFDLYIPEEDTSLINEFELRMRRFIRKNFDKPVTLDYRVFPFQGKRYTARPNASENESSEEE